MNLIFKIWGIYFLSIKVWFPCCFEICKCILQIIQIKASESRKYKIMVFYFILLHIFFYSVQAQNHLVWVLWRFMQTDTVHVCFPARCDPRMAVKSFVLWRPLRNYNFHLLRRTLGGCATYHGGIVSFLTGHTGIYGVVEKYRVKVSLEAVS